MGNAGTGTPLWQNGPPDKTVLCNACGSRWTTKGSLANYTPIHRKDDIDDDEPRISKLKPPTSNLTWSRIESNSPMQGSLTYGGEGRIWPESGRRRPASELLGGEDSASELLRDWW